MLAHTLIVGEDLDVPERSVPIESPRLIDADIPEEVLKVFEEDTARYVIGDNDDREPVTTTREWPYSSVVKLYIYFNEDDIPGTCTGSLIEEDAVLTAAHCVFDKKSKKPAKKVKVVPGQYQEELLGLKYTRRPFGTAWSKEIYFPDEYVQLVNNWYHNIPYDFAVVRLKTSFDWMNTRSYAVHPDPMDQPITLLAYHGDIEDGKHMMISKDKVRRVFDNGTFNHYIDLEDGASGGGITATNEWEQVIIGVVSAHWVAQNGNKYNIAMMITDQNYDVIEHWATMDL